MSATMRPLSEKPVFYVYLLSRPYGDCAEAYVGKGSGDRVKDHFWLASKHKNTHLAAIFAKSATLGLKVTYTIIESGLTEAEAFALEIKMISEIGRANEHRPGRKVGTLCNHTDGGEGQSGRSLTDSQKQAISLRHKGVPKTGMKAKGVPATGKNAKGHKRIEQGLAKRGKSATGRAAKGIPKTGRGAKGCPATGGSAKGCVAPETIEKRRATYRRNHPNGRPEMLGNSRALGYRFTPEQLKKTADGRARSLAAKREAGG